jgi:hypothetical protein
MIDEAADAKLRSQLESKLAQEGRHEVRRTRLNNEDFQTMKIQLLALGITRSSQKKRAVSDTNTYWSLTPYGRHYTMTLKAIRASGEAA